MEQELGALPSELSRSHVKLARQHIFTIFLFRKNEIYIYIYTHIEPLERKDTKGENTHYIDKRSSNSILF